MQPGHKKRSWLADSKTGHENISQVKVDFFSESYDITAIADVKKYKVFTMKKENSDSQPRGRGRPRAFDREEALDCAVDIFWTKGYGPTTVEDLTNQMGINPASLYGAFGNKHDLFMQALDRYTETFGGLPTKAFLKEQDIRQAVGSLFDTTIRGATTTKRPRGCLLISVASEIAARDPEVRSKLSRGYAARVAAIAERIAEAQETGRLPKQPDAESLAKMIVSITHSLIARARMGASRKELLELAGCFLDLMVPISD